MNIYRYRFPCACPNNGKTITYSLEISTSRTIMVEEIKAFCKFKFGFHEDLANMLIDRFGGVQTLKAFHHGVEIETRR